MSQFAAAKVTNNGTPGVWTELFASDSQRSGAAIQNLSDTAVLYIAASADQPASGTLDGELQIPVAPAYYKFDFIPGARWWVRSTVASSLATSWTW